MPIQDIIIRPTNSDPIIEFTGSSGNVSKIQQSALGLVLSSSLNTLVGETWSNDDFNVRKNTTLGMTSAHNTTISGDLAVNGGDITTTATILSVGNTSTSTSHTLSLGNAAITTGTKTVNLGTGGTGGTTNINVGASNAGTTTVNSPNVTLTGDLAVNGGDITTTSSTFNIGNPSTSSQILNLATAALSSGAKTVNIGTGATSTAITNVNIGQLGKGDITLNGLSTIVKGTLEVEGSSGIKSDRIVSLTGLLYIEGRNALSIPVIYRNTSSEITTFTNTSVNRSFTCPSSILIADLSTGDTIRFYSHLKKNTVTGNPGSSALYTSIINLGLSDATTTNIISKIQYDNDNWYEVSHMVEAHVFSKTGATLVLTTTGTASNVWNSETSSTPPTIIPRIITLTGIVGGDRLYFVQRGIISGHDTVNSWSQPVERYIDKTLLVKI